MKKLFFLPVFIIFLLFPSEIRAQTGVPFAVEQDNFFIQTVHTANPSETVLVKNLSAARIKIQATLEGYGLPDEEVADEKIISKHSIDFATISKKTLEIEPYSTETINVSFKIPEAAAADYYGSLVLNDGNFSTKTQFTLRLPGLIKEEISLLSTSREGNTFNLKIKNTGNYTTNVHSVIEVRTLTREIANVTTEEFGVKAGQIANIKVSVNNLLPAFYQTQVTVVYGEKETQITSLMSFWVWPGLFIAIGLLTISTIIFVFWKLLKR